MKPKATALRGFAIARRFAPELVEHRSRFARIAVLALSLAALQLLRPWPIQWVFDGALVPTGESRWSARAVIWIGASTTLAIAVVYALVQYIRNIDLADLEHRVTRGLRYRIFAHLTRLSPLYHSRQKSGDLLVRLMGDVPMVTTMIVESPIELFARAVIVIGTIIVMAILDPLLTITVLGVVPPLVLVVRWVSGHIRVAVRKQRKKEGALADYLHEAIAATETVQSLGGSQQVVRKFARGNRRSARAGLKARRLVERLSGSVESLLGCVTAGVLALGSLRVVDGRLTPGELLVFLSYTRALVKPMRAASKHATRIAKGTACGERILAILDENGFVRSKPDAQPTPTDPTRLTFDDVSFAYPDGTTALDSFAVEFRRGELSALVGRSGAGKSTAALLALRLFDPDSGNIRLDGLSLDEFDLESLRDRVGLALQQTTFFGASIRENLLLGRPDASDEEITEALRASGSEAFVAQQPGGIDAVLGAAGRGLSGGESSRLALARTLLRQTPILILDEPFAGLDRKAVLHVAETLHGLAHDRIVIVIAHDFERLDVYDHVVFMEHGRAKDSGSHAELLARLPKYAETVRTRTEVVS